MSSHLAGGLRAVVLATVLGTAVLAARLLLDAIVAPGGWYLLPFLAVFAATRAGGPATGILVVGGVLLGDALLPRITADGTIAGPGIPVATHLALDVGASLIALATATALRDAGSRQRASSLAAERSARRLLAAARREAAARELATEVADPRSIRQVADRFAVRARDMLDAAGVVVIGVGERSSDRAAGGAVDAPLATAGQGLGRATIAALVEASVAAGQPRCAVGPADSLETVLMGRLAPGGSHAEVGAIGVPLLAGTGTIGAAVVALDPRRNVDAEELEGLMLLGRIAAEGVARLDLAALSRRETGRAAAAADRIARLQRLAADLGRELDLAAIARLVVDAATEGTGGSAAVLHRVDHVRGELELLHARGYPAGLLDHERRLALEAALPGPVAAREGRRVVVTAAEWSTAFPGATHVPSIAGLREIVAVPLGREAPVAVLVIGRAGEESLDADDLGFLEAVAEHGAQAVRRAGLVDLLRDRDRRLGLTLGVARAGSWELDLRRREFDASPALRRLYGLPDAAPLAGLEAYLAIVDDADRDLVRGEIQRVAAGGGSFTLEFRVRRHDGATIRVLGVGRTFLDGLGRPVRLMAIDRDVSVERAAEDERERLLQQEREGRRLSEAFFGVMSHELRTPVTTILAGARILGRGRRLDPADRDLMDDIAAEADRLHRLIEDLLVLSRLERGNLALAQEPVHIGHLIRRVAQHEARRWPDTTFDVPEQIGGDVAEGEETYVEQVLRNLLSNAAKYSPAGSMVRVRVERDGDQVAVRVLDMGPGVGSGEVGDLFSLFYRSPATAAAASGAGIGLFVCDRLVRAMGGRIWAHRRADGPGSEFGFALRAVHDELFDEDDGLDLGREPLAVGPS